MAPPPDPNLTALWCRLIAEELHRCGVVRAVLCPGSRNSPLLHALHRLALESQVLLTDAWPGVFDDRVITAIRTVQEAVERILSGQDVRYYPAPESARSEQTT